ncbi:MAG: NUDIX hydrolase [Bacteroidetes bacterium]|nr:NUDIX hydrolase [Bacteroidota bacterium]
MVSQQEYGSQEKHLLAVDCVIFGYERGELKLLLFKRQLEPEKGNWSLIGGWVKPNETVEQAAERVLLKITGLSRIFQEEVKVFSAPDRDPGGRVVSVAFYALIDIKSHDKELVKQYGAQWWPVTKLPELIFDHAQMVNFSLQKLREKASFELVGVDLLPPEFTITQLRQLYNSIFSREFDPGNFRKKILSLNAVVRLDEKDTLDSKKGAYYYIFKKADEIDVSVRIVNS